MKLNIFVRKLHKWLGLILAIQFIIWAGSGLLMSFLPAELLLGEHTMAKISPVFFNSNKPIPIDKLSIDAKLTIKNIDISNGNRGLMYTITDDKGKNHFFNANTGEKFTPMNKQTAVAIAQTNYSGPGAFIKADLNEDSSLWIVSFDDWESTDIHLEPKSGAIIDRANIYNRVFVYLYSFHLMDYNDRNWSNWLLRFFASVASLFVISGVYLLFKSKYKKDLGLLSKTKQ